MVVIPLKRESNNFSATQRQVCVPRATNSILPLCHPSYQSIERKADVRFQMIYFDRLSYGVNLLKTFPYRLNRMLKNMLNHSGPWIKRKYEK